MVRGATRFGTSLLSGRFRRHVFDEPDPEWQLEDGSRVAIVGGGPSGSFSAIFLLDLATRAGIDLEVAIYEPRSFDRSGPAGCNHCGGIVSESLVQSLAAEGINIPPTVVQRGIESYVLHMDLGSVEIGSPANEQRIAAVYRGNGPRGGEDMPWDSFDGYLQSLAEKRGATVVRDLVLDIERTEDRPILRTARGTSDPYDLVVLATGVNSNLASSVIDDQHLGRLETSRTYLSEFRSDAETIRHRMGNSMHVFMVDVPGVEFAALVPKGDYITFAMLGEDIDTDLVTRFLSEPAVRRALPFDWIPSVCSCTPLINVGGPSRPFADRLVAVGDSGVTRLYKDGIGAAYRTAHAMASAAVVYGVSANDFADHYLPVCKQLDRDNRYGRILFAFTWLFRKLPFMRRAVLRMVDREQRSGRGEGGMSEVLWNLFTGSAPYREVFWTSARPSFLMRLGVNVVASLAPSRTERRRARAKTQD